MLLCSRTCNTSRALPSTPRRSGSYKLIALAAVFAALAAEPAFPQGDTTNTNVTVREGVLRVIEWDLPRATDVLPGAITIEPGDSSTNIVWFVTRASGSPEEFRVYRVQMPRGLAVRNAPFRSWQLHPNDTSPTGGLKRVRSSWDRRFVFVRTTQGLHRIDTTANTSEVLFFPDFNGLEFVSDVAVDPYNKVYWAVFNDNGFIKRVDANISCGLAPALVPAACPNTTQVVTWPVGGTVGQCDPGNSVNTPCLSGIAVHPKSTHLIYFSDNVANQIGELDTRNDTTRRWDLSQLVDEYDPKDSPPQGPRQLNIDDDGIIWVVTGNTLTGSGHLVSLDPKDRVDPRCRTGKKNRLTKHRIPTRFSNDPWGIAPDGGLIGYTDNEATTPTGVGVAAEPDHKVAMLIPREIVFEVCPIPGQAPRATPEVTPETFAADSADGVATPNRRRVPTRITRKQDGIFVEARVDKNADMTQMMNSSRLPAGITPDRERATGSFFYAVGESNSDPFIKRIGHARLPRDRERAKRDRDDEDFDDDEKPRGVDDDDDDDGMKNDVDLDDDDDGIMDIEDDDDDNDGIKNEHDTKANKEAQFNYRSELAASQFQDFPVTTLPNALALIVLATADNPLTPISIECRNAAGQIVATSIAAPGTGLVTLLTPAAGTYLVRVKNHATTIAGIDTAIITRDPRLP